MKVRIQFSDTDRRHGCFLDVHALRQEFVGVTWFLVHNFRRISKNYEKMVLAFSSLAARPHVKKVGSHMMDFYGIWYLKIFRKSLKKIQISLKSDKNNRYFSEA
jgi:hypothetical protein